MSVNSFGQVPPRPAALVESLGALGYSLEAAIADLLDNSISAGAKLIDVVLDWNDGAPYCFVLDDGSGMTHDVLREAMRFGGTGPGYARREGDLGRYGLGLKTASFSQCRRVTVATKSKGPISCACWDLDILAEPGCEWMLLDRPAVGSEGRLRPLNAQPDSGTLVLWELLHSEHGQNLSRFLESVERVEKHLAMVFHRFISGDQRKVIIRVNSAVVEGWDPFITRHPATITKPLARLDGIAGRAHVRGYVLPHRDRFATADEHEAGGGPNGWVAQQGFYIYRSGRLIVSGGWLGLGGTREWLRDEASQLARIKIDIGNDSDSSWRIDVRKATARPPGHMRNDLTRVAMDVRRSAREIYAHRGSRGGVNQTGRREGLWMATRSQRFPYAIKRDHPLVQAALDTSGDPALLDAMLVAIEKSLPGLNGTHAPMIELEVDNELVAAAATLYRNLVALGVDGPAALARVARTEPFSQITDLAAHLQRQLST